MAITISDEVLKEAGLDDREGLIEIACRLFDAGKLPLPLAARLAGLNRGEMEDELLERKISLYRPSVDEYIEDVATMTKLERPGPS